MKTQRKSSKMLVLSQSRESSTSVVVSNNFKAISNPSLLKQNADPETTSWSASSLTPKRSSARTAPAESSIKSDREKHSNTRHAELKPVSDLQVLIKIDKMYTKRLNFKCILVKKIKSLKLVEFFTFFYKIYFWVPYFYLSKISNLVKYIFVQDYSGCC